MSQTNVVLGGTLNADGSLQLDERPNLPPGRVQVIVHPVEPAKSTESILDTIHGIWKHQNERGHIPRTKDEIDAELLLMREEWQTLQLAIEELQADSQRVRE
jgi:hypothetical protein